MDSELKALNESDVLRHLSAVLDSPQFTGAPQLRAFLKFVVTETLEGRGSYLKEYCIGVNVFTRRPDFDPKQDAIVRVQASQLRARLESYYASANAFRGIQIQIPKGGYLPRFVNTSTHLASTTESSMNELRLIGELALWRRTSEGVAIAMRNFARMVELQPEDSRGHLGLAETYRASLDTELVKPTSILPRYKTALSAACRLSPDSSDVHVLQSNYQFATHQVNRESKAQLRVTLARDPGNARVYFWYAATLAAEGLGAPGLAAINEAVRLQPQSLTFHTYVGRFLFYIGQPEHAVERLLYVTSLDPNLGVAWLWLALSLTDCERYEEAIDAVGRFNAVSTNAVSLACKSFVLGRAGYVQEAETLYTELMHSREITYVSPYWLAAICAALGNRVLFRQNLDLARAESSYPLIWAKVDSRLDLERRPLTVKAASRLAGNVHSPGVPEYSFIRY